MALNDKLREAIEESRRELEGASAQENLAAAALLRSSKAVLTTQRQRELADEMAAEFDQRAAGAHRSASPAA